MHFEYYDDVMLVDIDWHLQDDDDHDGFYTTLELDLDVDANTEREVYITILLENHYGELVYRHEGSDFVVYNAGYGDSYHMTLGFHDGLPRDYYQLVVQVHDAYTTDILDTVTEHEWANLAGLPLESNDRDHSHGYVGVETSLGVEVTAAGAMGIPWVLCLSLLVLFKLCKRQSN